MAPNMTDVVKALRSLLNSTQNGLLQKHLWRDFREMEGYTVPFKEFGYNTFTDFLIKSNEFELTNTQEGYHVRARLTANSIHITEMVSAQNRARKKKSAKPIPYVPRRNIRLESNWNLTAYSKAQTQPQPQPRAQAQSQPRAQMQYQPRVEPQVRPQNQYQQRVQQQPRLESAFQHRPTPQQMFRAPMQNQPQNQVNHFIQQVAASMFSKQVSILALQQAQLNLNNSNRALYQIQNVHKLPTPAYVTSVQTNTLRSNVPTATLTEVIDFTQSTPPPPPSLPKPIDPMPAKPVVQMPSNPAVQMPSNPRIPTNSTPVKSSSDDQWEHDLWDQTPLPKNRACLSIKSEAKPPQVQPTVQPVAVSKPVLNAQNVNPVTLTRHFMSQRNVNVAPKEDIEPTEKPKLIPTTLSPLWFSQRKSTVFERLGTKPDETVNEPRQSAQSRLNFNTSPEPIIQVPETKQSDTVDFMAMQQQSMHSADDIKAMADDITNNYWAGLAKKDPKTALTMYCKQRGYDAPIFSTAISNFKKYEGLVKFEGMTYSTLPFDYPKASEAEIQAAKVALENIKDYPISRESSDIIAQKIFDCIADNGIFLKYLPNIFEQRYETSLPDDWRNIIQNRPEMFSVHNQPTNYNIIFKVLPQDQPKPKKLTIPSPPSSEFQHMKINTITSPKQNETIKLKPIKLPWHKSEWKVDVTWVVSTVEVWGQLSGSDPLEQLNHDLEEIESKLSRGIYPEIIKNVIVGGIYLTVHELSASQGSYSSTYTAYRIQVKALNEEEKLALCFYIDDGFEEWLPLDATEPKDLKFYQISCELCEIPPQAIHFSLFNLEDFAENSQAKDEVAKYLSDMQFVVKVKSTKEQYESQQEANLDARVTVIFYDMTTEDDVNVNKTILENTCSKLRPPQLEQNRSTVVHVTHVSDCGDIYCRIHNSKEMHHIKQLINRLTCNGIGDAYRVDANDLASITKTLRLVFDVVDKRWYRATILINRFPQKLTQCQFVDYGQIKYIEPHNIYKLEKLSTALSKYPPQAIVVRLNDFHSSECTPKVVDRLRELLCCQKTVFIQTVNRTEIPMVNVWKRIDNVLCKINDSIRMENSPDMVALPDSDSFSSDEKYEARNVL